ncbi:MAG: hypothetical protein HPY50_16050 [Firmicutes bacterium]|nr:hypothetical protein [Bacillota bacterium]
MTALFKNNGARALSMDDLLISIMLRYPEIGTVKYNPRYKFLQFTFIILESLDRQRLEDFAVLLPKALDAYSYLEKRRPGKIKVEYSIEGGVTLVMVTRDVDTLNPDEITFVVEFFKDWFDTESREDVFEEEILFQEEIIRQSLEQTKKTRNSRSTIALREEGQVIVYNK